jgi:hypothetical protein
MEHLCKLSQAQMRNFLITFLRSKYETVTVTAHYLIAHGEIPICLVAHMDTVFAQPAMDVYYDKQKNVMWSPQGLGADDRAGIFAIIQILQSGLRPHVIFTTDEEKGCVGSMMLATKKVPFKDIRYFIQLDRRGSKDCVFYDCDNPDFTAYIESFGFEEAIGSFTDISMFCPDWGIAGVNLSVGYLNEHSISETLMVDDLLNTIDKVHTMLTVPENDIPFFEYIELKYNAAYGGRFWSQFYKSGDCKCDGCGQWFYAEEVFDAIGLDESVKHYCPDCIVDHMYWCKKCGNAYEAPAAKGKFDEICDKCKGDEHAAVSGHPDAV